MPVTKTANRALRVSKRKEVINKRLQAKLEIAIRAAKKEKTNKAVSEAVSLTDRAAKKKIIHKNKAARIKSSLSKLISKKSPQKKSSKPKKTSRKKKS